jgi:hypothetical protein
MQVSASRAGDNGKCDGVGVLRPFDVDQAGLGVKCRRHRCEKTPSFEPINHGRYSVGFAWQMTMVAPAAATSVPGLSG